MFLRGGVPRAFRRQKCHCPLASIRFRCLSPPSHHLYRRNFSTTSPLLAPGLFSASKITASDRASSDSHAKKKTIAYMFRQLKLAGAHPDIVWSIDAAKAQHNGEEMARLETLLHDRATKGRSSLSGLSPQLFFFWLRDQRNSNTLRKVSSFLHLSATPEILHDQLQKLFQEAGIEDDFTLEGEEAVRMSVESLLQYADAQQNTHIKDAGALYIRAEKAIEQLRRHGVVVVVSDADYSYLVSLPEAGFHQLVDNVPPPAQQCGSWTGSAGRASRPMKSIVGPHGEIDPDAQEYMQERGLRPFELRMTGTATAMEVYVSAFERLERLYEVHRGRACRPGVCLVLRIPSLSSALSSGGGGGFLARDGCLVLSMHHLALWESFLLGLTQEEWKYAVEQHRQWRVGSAPKLEAQRRQLKKLADAFGFFQLRMHGPMGAMPLNAPTGLDARSPSVGRPTTDSSREPDPFPPSSTALDVESTMAVLLREEPIIRKTLHKYKVYSSVLQKRGTMVMVPRLTSKCHSLHSSSSPSSCSTSATTTATSAPEEIGFRLQGDGMVYFNLRMMRTPQMLRVLRDNLKRIESFKVSYDRCTAVLEHLSRVLPIDFSIDTEWKIHEETRFAACLEKFVNTVKANQHPIAALLKSVEHAGGGSRSPSSDTNPHSSPQEALRAQLEYEAGAPLPQSAGNTGYRKALERRYVWIISEKLEALPTGVLYIPYNVDFASLRRCLLAN